ncbi:helix-turn-helix domain-containing protein [Actinotalea sp. C106]|uniref:helix-turn-helix domain-containing protein n=1 Tax=Actinotalea sp. C106 TaxID=2908644 RepID=UPI00202829E7|nr:helix-turn-helix domain-containing protein [Actinotalea sp. C106]
MSASPILNARSLPRLGTAVKALRLDRGLSQAELARAAGVSRQWVVSLERGRTAGAELGRVMAVLDALDASLAIRDDREHAPQ